MHEPCEGIVCSESDRFEPEIPSWASEELPEVFPDAAEATRLISAALIISLT
jgi:hypothetical protein